MAFRSLDPGSVAPNHTHPSEHQAYILEDSCTLSVAGKDYTVSKGDAVLVPPHSQHEWRSNSQHIAKWLVFNPVR
jgi:quercetin dioxygenase-like cupin family protein